jgi:carboxymethylenebutenolidase
MCYDASARPPFPPVAGGAGAAEGREVVLDAEDGTRFRAYAATAATPGGSGIVILPDVRGLHAFYRELAVRFAEAGVHATAIDYFGRTAGIDDRGDDFDFMTHVQQAQPDTIAKDVATGAAHLRSPDGGRADSVFTVGFCFGGRNSFNQAARGHGLAGVIGFYGRLAAQTPEDANAPILLSTLYACPVLGLFGGADSAIPRESVDDFGRALSAAGIRHDLVVYDGAPHSFFDRTYAQYEKEGNDAWTRILAFIEDNA